MKSTAFFLSLVGLLMACKSEISTADQLIASHLGARGGLEAVEAIQTLTFIGTYEEPRFKQIHRFDKKRPNLIRITTSYDSIAGTFGYCEGFDGAAWEYSSRIPVRVVGEPSRALKNASRFEKDYINYKQKGFEAYYKGETVIRGHELYHLQLVKEGKNYNYFFDTKSLMETVSIGNGPFHGEGASIEIFELRSDFRPVNGVLFSFMSEQKSGDDVLATMKWDRIEANQTIEDEWFSPPLGREEKMLKDIRETTLADGIAGIASKFTTYRELNQGLLDKKIENQMNTFGYELISYERYEDAIAVFKVAIDNYPNSGNLHDSLGETYLTIGDTLNAIKYYERSIALDPGNTHAENVLQKIR